MGLDYVDYPMLPRVRVHLIINSIITFLALLIVGLRIMTRVISGANLWWDDYLIIFAVPQGIGMLVIQGLWAPMGVGYQLTADFPMGNLVHILKMLVSYELIYSTAISTIKLSVMLFYMRVFVNQGLRLATKLIMAFVALWSAGNILQVFLICRPFAALYTPGIEAKCGNQITSFIAIGAFNVITDVLILMLPLPTIWSLKMSTSAKLGLSGVFLLGLIVSMVEIVRIVFLTRLDLANNLTGTMMYADVLSTLEINIAIICVSMPMLGSMFTRCLAGRRRRGSYLDPSSNGTDAFKSRGSRFNKLKSDTTTGHDIEEDFSMEHIYGPDKDVHYQSTIAAKNNDPPTTDIHNAPTVALASNLSTFLEDPHPGVIQVRTKWSISRD